MPLLPGWSLFATAQARLRSLYRSLFHRDQVDHEMQEEFAHHLAMRTDDLVRQGVSPTEAVRRARMEFGHPANHRADARESRGLVPFDRLQLSWLDVKLAFRMLVKNPILSLAAVFALAVGIPVGIAPAHLARALKAPLPGDADNRVRAIRYWDPVSSGVASTDYQDFDHWTRTLKSFTALGAFRTSTYNVAYTASNNAAEGGSADGTAEPMPGAQLSASTFEVLQTTPQLGRALNATDTELGAPPVVVISHQLWTSRFASDPRIVGRAIRIGRTLTTVVGVMPEGFHFPSHEALWLPLRSEAFGVGREGQSAQVRIVGRLAEDVSAERAQSELSAVARTPVRDGADTQRRQQLRPEVVPFGLLYMGLPRGGLDTLPEFRYVQLLMLVLLLVACGNVAMLVYARTATRTKEIAIRTALGASRSRIVSQIFVETLVMALLAAAVGLFAVDWALGHINLAAIAGESALPYWLSLGVTRLTLMQAMLLAAFSATVAGVWPALRITGRDVQHHMRGGSSIRFGKITGVLVVADIAVSVAAVGLALTIVDQATDLREDARAAGIPAAEYLAVQFRLPEATPSVASSTGASAGAGALAADDVQRRRESDRLGADQRALVAALQAEPGVLGVAVGDALPRMEHRSQPIEIDGTAQSAESSPKWVRTAKVDASYFQALNQRVLVGRDFLRSDVEDGRPVVIVNSALADRVLGGGDPLGRRVRFRTPSDPASEAWYDIVGVVGPLGVNMVSEEHGEAVYLPAAPGTLNPMQLGVHAAVPPLGLTARVRSVANGVDPDLVMGRSVVLSEVRQGDWYLTVAMAGGLTVLVGVLIALATSGLYAMLSLSVTERTRELGIRAALGAPRRSLLMTILRRSLVQIGLGAAIGLPIATRFVYEVSSTPEGGVAPRQVDAVLYALGLAAAIVGFVGLCSCLVPTRRVLAIEASEAMRAES